MTDQHTIRYGYYTDNSAIIRVSCMITVLIIYIVTIIAACCTKATEFGLWWMMLTSSIAFIVGMTLMACCLRRINPPKETVK